MSIFLTFLALALFFGGCKVELYSLPPFSAQQIAEVVAASQKNTDELALLLPEDTYFGYYLSNIYSMTEIEPVDGAIFYNENGMSATELAVFLFGDEKAAKAAKEELEEYIKRRIGDFEGYAPLEAAMLRDSLAETCGSYVALLICEDPQGARSKFLACFGDEPPELPDWSDSKKAPDLPEEKTERGDYINENYDPEAILRVWNGDQSAALSEKNRAILEKCAEIIDAIIKPGMDEFEREQAVHDYIIDWADYDAEANSNAPSASPNPDNDNPYGLLFGKAAICTGYTSTFQLFMDMLSIECISVDGSSGDPRTPHAWNMVKIAGDWYCVDVTWDDPSGMDHDYFATHEYFNVTSDHMRKTGHYWDESSVPEAKTELFLRFEL
ncbi:MAG: DUF4358 domain-containing protein [Oscillospiraceae bacterium]|nr:DUF4358 domain-containing protein [Oscillospiraceae bacterium]